MPDDHFPGLEQVALAPFLKDGGRMGAAIRTFDWASTPLGPPDTWPATLKAVVRIMLTTRHPMLIFWGADNLCLYNDAYSLSLGPEKHPAMLGQPARLHWPETWAVIEPQIGLVMRGEGSTWHENHLVPILRRGRLEDVYWTYSYGPIDDATAPNCVGGVLVICKETTGQVLSDTALRASEARYRTMAETLPQLVWTCQPDGKCDYLSRQWVEYTGMDEAEQLGLDWLDRVIHPDDRDRTYAHWMGAVRGDHPYDIDYRIRRHDGQYCWFKTRGTPVYGEDGDIAYWFGTCTDIEDIVEAREVLARSSAELDALVRRRTSALEAAQDALRESRKLEAMGQLTGGVAHDFNNLLTPILGGLEMLQRRGVGGPREQRIIAGALAATERAKILVQRLLAFARRQPLQLQPVNLVELVRGMADLIASTSGPRISVDLALPENLPPAHADANQIEMALLNLSVNARDAMDEGGRLSITLAMRTILDGEHPTLGGGDYIVLSVADTGRGMDEATLARAIEPFFSTKGIGQGTGLGLSMVHGLASQLGGDLTITSKPGLGTNVVLVIPASHQALAEESGRVPPPPPPAGACARVLLVDDEELVRVNTAEMLAELGYDVIEAANGREALALVDQGAAFDILVTDHLMPGLTGEQLAFAIREKKPDTPVLIVSGYADSDGISPTLARLTKPFRRDELAQSVAQAL